MSKILLQCDCCDYFTIPPDSDYEICPICFWEEDAYGIRRPEANSGANHGLTLHEGRENFRKLGACASEFLPKVIAVTERAKFHYAGRTI